MGRGAEHIQWPIHLEVKSSHYSNLDMFVASIVAIIFLSRTEEKSFFLHSHFFNLKLLPIVCTGFKGDCEGESSS